MLTHLPKQKRLFKFKDVAERLICPNCKGIVKTVIPATTQTYLVHASGEICVLDNNRGCPDG